MPIKVNQKCHRTSLLKRDARWHFFIIILKRKRLAFIHPANFLFHGEKGLQKLRTECTALLRPGSFPEPVPG